MNSDAAAARHIARPTVALERFSAAALLGLLCVVVVLVGWRRLAGALSYPLPLTLLLPAGLLTAAAAAAVRFIWRCLPSNSKRSRPDWPARILASAAVLGLGGALSLPGTNLAGLGVFWTVLAVEEFWAWRPILWRMLRRGPPVQGPIRLDPPQTPAPHPPPGKLPAQVPLESSSLPAVAGDNVMQQLTRRRTPDGIEELSGWLRMPFSEGQRTTSVHVAFCPPFPRAPELAVEQLDGPTTRIKTAQVLPHGVRFDLKLAASAEKRLTVMLQFSARSEPRT